MLLAACGDDVLSVADAFLYVPAGLQHIATNKKMQHPRSSGSILLCDGEGFFRGGRSGMTRSRISVGSGLMEKK